jgi:hypothetical protein
MNKKGKENEFSTSVDIIRCREGGLKKVLFRRMKHVASKEISTASRFAECQRTWAASDQAALWYHCRLAALPGVDAALDAAAEPWQGQFFHQAEQAGWAAVGGPMACDAFVHNLV